MKKTLITGVFGTLIFMLPSFGHADGVLAGNVKSDSHAPIGVMGDHMHHKDEWMISYRLMNMTMDGMRDGTTELTSVDVLTASAANPTNYIVTPTKMNTQMHMLGGMYAPSDDLTLMVMGSYLIRTMDHLTDAATTFTTRSEGIGDTKVAGLIRLYDDDINHVHVNAGINLPTGSIEETDGTPAAPSGTRLPFKMQLGSGTLDLMPGVTYTGNKDHLGWGAQYQAMLPIGRNSNDYSLGDMHQISSWGSYRFADWISASVRLTGKSEAKIDGNQLNPIMPAMIPTTDPDHYGGEKLDLGFGVNLAGQGTFRGHRLGVEFVAPIYQNLNGPQLQDSASLMVGYQYSW